MITPVSLIIAMPLLRDINARQWDRNIEHEMFNHRIVVAACRVFNAVIPPGTYPRRFIFKVILKDYVKCLNLAIPFVLLKLPPEAWDQALLVHTLLVAVVYDLTW